MDTRLTPALTCSETILCHRPGRALRGHTRACAHTIYTRVSTRTIYTRVSTRRDFLTTELLVA